MPYNLQLHVYACLIMIEGSGETSGAHIVLLEACTALLRGTSLIPMQKDFPCTESLIQECLVGVGVTI